MGFFKDFRFGWKMSQHAKDVVFLGKCPCGSCDFWIIQYHGRRMNCREKTYHKLTKLAAL